MRFSEKIGLPKQAIFGADTDTKNVPKYLTIYFRESQQNFAKMYQSSKLLLERIALAYLAVFKLHL